MKKIAFISLILLIIDLSISSCSILPSSRPVTDSQMQTEIVQILTAMVTETATPLPEPTIEATMPAPTEEVIIVTTQETTPSSEIGQLITSTPSELSFDSTPAPLPQEGNPPSTLAPIPTSSGSLPTATQGTSPTQSSTDPIIKLGSPTWTDSFDNGDNWPLGIDKFVNLKVGGGSLQMMGLTMKNGWRVSRQHGTNFYLQLAGKMASCSGADNYGLFFRVPNLSLADRGYLFGVSCDGKFALRKWGDDKMTVLINWKESDAIIQGSNQVNKLGVWVKGSEIKLYVNGVQVGSTKESSFSQGYIGLYVGPKETTNLTAILDELSFWTLQ